MDISKQENKHTSSSVGKLTCGFLFTKVFPVPSQLISSYRTSTNHCMQFTANKRPYYYMFHLIWSASRKKVAVNRPDSQDPQNDHIVRLKLCAVQWLTKRGLCKKMWCWIPLCWVQITQMKLHVYPFVEGWIFNNFFIVIWSTDMMICLNLMTNL